MKLNVVRELLSSPSADAVQAFLDDESTVFWIDWRQEDETIAESCELTLNTGSLDGELIEKTDDGSDYQVEIIYNTKRERVPLTFSESDRYLTILTINRVLIQTTKFDSALIPMAATHWDSLHYHQTTGTHYVNLSLIHI